MFTVKDVCKHLAVSVRTVYRLIKTGRLPAKRFAGEWRFELQDVDKLLAYSTNPDGFSEREPGTGKSPAKYVIKPDLMSLNEVCVYLGLSRFTIYRLLRNEKLVGVKSGGRWRFARDDVRRFLTRGRDVPSYVSGMNFVGGDPATYGGAAGVMGLGDACKLLGVNRLSIYRLIKEGKLPATKVGGAWRLIKTEVARYLLNKKYRYGMTGIRGVFFYAQALDKYRNDKTVYYVDESAYDGFVGNRQNWHDYKTLRSLRYIPKMDLFFAGGGFVLALTYEQYENLPPAEHDHWSGYRVPDKEIRNLEF
ncbi:MAG: helix-turn-helix domain-containing protein [Planctomycetes bacterium]|nr:helix-turn-helix domain-containing protein [Planctomycetota bacterium]